MKTILTLLLVGALCLTSRAGTNAMLCGIRIVETQDKPYPPRGKLGERGSYQFRRSTWKMHTSSSFDLAENREVATNVAKRHYAWIEAQLKSNGVEPSPYNVAMAWNAGVNAVIRGRVPAVARDYATRVLNIAGTIPEFDAPESKPRPAWRAPILIAGETAPSPESPATPSLAAAPAPISLPAAPAPAVLALAVPAPAPAVPESPVTNIVSTDTADQNEQIEVRFHTNPITLAFNRTSSPEPVKEVLPEQLGGITITLAAAEVPQATGRM